MPTRFDEGGYWEIITRQMSIVTKSEQNRFKESTIAIVGCGGIGGSVIEMLTRMGVGNLILIDYDTFTVSNLNRQIISSFKNLKLSKTEVAKERVRQINPYVNVKVYNEKIDENNIKNILNNSDIVIDALDNILTRVILSRYCKNKNKPLIHGAIDGTMGQITVYTDKTDYETMFNLPSKNKKIDNEIIMNLKELEGDIPPVIGPTPNIVGALEAIEAFKLITEIGTITEAPNILKFDLLNLNSFNIEKNFEQ